MWENMNAPDEPTNLKDFVRQWVDAGAMPGKAGQLAAYMPSGGSRRAGATKLGMFIARQLGHEVDVGGNRYRIAARKTRRGIEYLLQRFAS